MTIDRRPATIGIILAGGLARRMGGGDKGRQIVGGRSILSRVAACLGPQVDALIINANGDASRFADLGLPVVADATPDYPGPLAGILAGLDWAAASGVDWVVSVSGDCPFLPGDLVQRLHQVRGEAVYAVAASGGWAHPVIALWPTASRDELRQALLDDERKIDRFTGRHPTARAEWPTHPHDPFFNVNTPDDLAEAGRIVAAMGG